MKTLMKTFGLNWKQCIHISSMDQAEIQVTKTQKEPWLPVHYLYSHSRITKRAVYNIVKGNSATLCQNSELTWTNWLRVCVNVCVLQSQLSVIVPNERERQTKEELSLSILLKHQQLNCCSLSCVCAVCKSKTSFMWTQMHSCTTAVRSEEWLRRRMEIQLKMILLTFTSLLHFLIIE